MKNLPRPIVFGLGAESMMVLTGTAYAATGGTFLLGRSNSATATTTLTNSAGTALALNSKSGTAPLKVNSSTKVGSLNADKVYGVSAEALALKAGKTGVIVGTPDDADQWEGTAKCPSGTYATGGGGVALGEDESLWYSGPDYDIEMDFIPNSWLALGPGNSQAWVICYNPRGAVPGAATSPPIFSGSAVALESHGRTLPRAGSAAGNG